MGLDVYAYYLPTYTSPLSRLPVLPCYYLHDAPTRMPQPAAPSPSLTLSWLDVGNQVGTLGTLLPRR